MPQQAVLYIFSGLPACGKTTLAMRLAQEVKAAYLRIDTVEQALRDVCSVSVRGEGYRLSYRVAADNLRVGLSVVADSCNPVALTRREWKEVATRTGALAVNIEVVCSNKTEHRRRAEERIATVPGLVLPSWDEIQNRDYERWEETCLRLDTAGKTVEQSVSELLAEVERRVR